MSGLRIGSIITELFYASLNQNETEVKFFVDESAPEKEHLDHSTLYSGLYTAIFNILNAMNGKSKNKKITAKKTRNK